jgi:hypothetical protein
MSKKWLGLERRITAFDALNEPLDQQLFGPSFDARVRQIRAQAEPSGINRDKYAPWKKPRIERSKEVV